MSFICVIRVQMFTLVHQSLLKISCVFWRGTPVEVKKKLFSFLQRPCWTCLSAGSWSASQITEIFCLAYFSSRTCVVHPEQNKYELPVGHEQSKTMRTRMITSLMATSIMLLLFMGGSPTQAGKCYGEGCHRTPEYPPPPPEKECPKGDCIIQLAYFCRSLKYFLKLFRFAYLSLGSLILYKQVGKSKCC